MQMTLNRERGLRHWVYGAGFFLNAGLAVAAYINSSLLEQFIGEGRVGLIYTLTYIVSFLVAINFYRIIERVGIRETLITLLLLDLAAVIGVAYFAEKPLSIPFLAANLIFGFLFTASLDLYLEHLSKNSVTGWIRGLFLGLANIAWLCSPLLASQLNTRFGFSAVYLASAIALLPVVFIVLSRLVTFPKRSYDHDGVLVTIKKLWRARIDSNKANILRIISIDFLLNFFYATMIIYLPILLHQHIGFEWTEIGIILTLMLIPFVIIDFTLGRVADKIGEKEFIVAGLIIAGLATLFIPFLQTKSILIWGAMLFTTRVGAATIELMKESYLFKKVNSDDIGIIFLSRSMNPLSYILAPLVASGILLFVELPVIFIFLGALVLSVLPIAWKLKDTR